jgi:hypothetical protein
MTTAATTDATFDIACSLSAAQKVERGAAFADLFADAEDVAELPDGYALRFPSQDAWITRAAELITAERKCCPFFRFALAFEPNGGPVWLHIAGPAEIKPFIREQMVPAHVRPRA